MARKNARRHGVEERINWLQGDLLAPLGENTPVDLIAANLPYIAAEEYPHLMPEVRDHEPRLALEAGEGGLAIIHRLIAQSTRALTHGGLLALEVGFDQAARVVETLATSCWRNVRVIDDYAGIPRHILAEREG